MGENTLAVPGDTHKKAIRASRAVIDPRPFRRIPPRVMKEEDYVDTAQKIIERDYYPDLPRLRAAKRLMLARAGNCQQTIAHAARELECMTPITALVTPLNGATPPTNEFAVSHSQQVVQPKSKTCLDRKVTLTDGRKVIVSVEGTTLDEFQRLYTSEDNLSFENIIREEKRKLNAKQAWIENASTRHNSEVVEAYERIEAGQSASSLIFGASEARTALMFHPIESQPSHEEPRELFNCNTRFSTKAQLSTDALDRQRAKMDRIRKANTESRDLSAMVASGQFGVFKGSEDGVRGEQRTVRGYAMEETPVLVPGMGQDKSPLMTWGEVANTPLPLGQGFNQEDHLYILSEEVATRGIAGHGKNTLGKQFEVQTQPTKEAAAHRLAEKLYRTDGESKKKRAAAIAAATAIGLTPGLMGGSGSGSVSSRKKRRVVSGLMASRGSSTPRSLWGGSANSGLPRSLSAAASATPIIQSLLRGR
eukprot:Lankesteria_metandrocarpae@DN4336_c0_g1_i1.p2